MTAPPAPAGRKARLAVFWIFSLCGVTSSLWSTSLPAISARLHVGETRLGPVRAMAAAGGTAVCGYLLVLLAPRCQPAGWRVTSPGGR